MVVGCVKSFSITQLIFDRLKAENPKLFEKLQVVAGDILSEDLGLSAEDRLLIQEEAQIIFHCAACVRFDMFLRDAVKMNTMGTKKVLELAEGVKNLEAFVHVSTSYCRCELPLFEEKLYPSKHRPEHVMHCVNWMDDELLGHLQPKIIEPQPNTYAYTKSLTEDLVSQYEGKFPIVIARPSIVAAAYKEPLPGWVDNLNGPTGLLVGAGKGRVHVQEFPFTVCLWYPGGSAKSSWIAHQFALFFTHMLPAYFVDLLMFLMGKKTFMIKIQKRINYGLEVLQYYTTKEWHFTNDYFEMDWSQYIRNYIKGAREYCCKEDPSTLPAARRLQKQLYYLDKAVQIMVGLLVSYFIYYYFNMLYSVISS
ncbi:hypothetical protein SFRURICE_016697 [Spodoptera frugiperda]|nr:hypothetical protein SFRURICE_016697 [Spodoptera frugiperda]